ncbi:MAG: hypothetical protein Q4A44_06200, partial [Bacteroidales bacterium]|nr:hypothetical protein [Bacteroidales bacterium]
MIYEIRIISDEAPDFLRVIQIDGQSTFLDLYEAILKACGYEDSMISSFFLCDEEWHRGSEITREDMGVGRVDVDIYAMDSVRLNQLLEEEQRMELVYDTFNERFFSLEVDEVLPGQTLEAAKVTVSEGYAPDQIIAADFDMEVAAAATQKAAAVGHFDIDEDLYG